MILFQEVSLPAASKLFWKRGNIQLSETTITNKNGFHEEIKSRLYMGNACSI
jgi:hypothetical protein